MTKLDDRNYVVIWRDELQSDKVFEEYCQMKNAIPTEDKESVKFYTISDKKIKSQITNVTLLNERAEWMNSLERKNESSVKVELNTGRIIHLSLEYTNNDKPVFYSILLNEVFEDLQEAIKDYLKFFPKPQKG